MTTSVEFGVEIEAPGGAVPIVVTLLPLDDETIAATVRTALPNAEQLITVLRELATALEKGERKPGRRFAPRPR